MAEQCRQCCSLATQFTVVTPNLTLGVYAEGGCDVSPHDSQPCKICRSGKTGLMYAYAGWCSGKASGNQEIIHDLVTWELGPVHIGCSVSLSGAVPMSPSGTGMVMSIGGSVPCCLVMTR